MISSELARPRFPDHQDAAADGGRRRRRLPGWLLAGKFCSTISSTQIFSLHKRKKNPLFVKEEEIDKEKSQQNKKEPKSPNAAIHWTLKSKIKMKGEGDSNQLTNKNHEKGRENND